MEEHGEDLMQERGMTEGPMPDDLDDIDNLVQCCRAAAALQPDSTAQPAQTCQVGVMLCS